ncbi:transmembrane protein 269 isoform X4 [Heliangelus exortis]|uniref:transmembrane protein 269 isoform X4 n=1 Tax=Heliangelus exortis TaxID=472823 RepID=UPI003A955DDD
MKDVTSLPGFGTTAQAGYFPDHQEIVPEGETRLGPDPGIHQEKCCQWALCGQPGGRAVLCPLQPQQAGFALPRQYHYSCWLLLLGFLLDLADGAVARQLDACSALGAKLDDFADFTTFGLATALLLQPQGVLGGLLAIAYVMAVFARLCFFSSAGIPFTYRGLPCPYASSLLASTFLLTEGNVPLLRVAAGVTILFMVDRGSYPHDKVLESQLWKKLVYTGGVVAILFSPAGLAPVYCLAWSMSYICFPSALWSCKA